MVLGTRCCDQICGFRYEGGTDPATLPVFPWDPQMSGYGKDGAALKNENCTDMAAYFGRMVGHYTAGGHTDSCGHFHPSGLHYNWTILSVLNEDEHGTGGPRYTRCFDAIRDTVEAINPAIILEGPEVVVGSWGASYAPYFIDPANHKDSRPPDIVSMHSYWQAGSNGDGSGYETLFTGVDDLVEKTIKPLAALRDRVAPKTDLVLNEWIPVLEDWCDATDAARVFDEHRHNLTHPLRADPKSQGCSDWSDPRSTTVGMNRLTLGWTAAAAQFAYGVGQLAINGRFKYVGNDDLACG